MRKMRFQENTIKDQATLNRGQSMLQHLYIKGYTHVNFSVYLHSVELVVYAPIKADLKKAELLIRILLEDGDYLDYEVFDDTDRPFVSLTWRGFLIETEDE